jgi:hypothetical protein
VLPEGEKAQIFLRDGRVVIRVPMKLRHVSGRTEIIAPQALGKARQGAPGKPSALAVALARSLRWSELLDQGRYPTVAALAAAVGLERSYVARVLNLSLLAPDLAEAILYGEAPSGLSLSRMRDDFPMEWVRQRIALGLQ